PVFGQQRTEDRGPIKRYRKRGWSSKRSAKAPEPVASNTEPVASNMDATVGSGPTTPPSTPLTSTSLFPSSSSSWTRVQVVSSGISSRLGWAIAVGVCLVVIAAVAVPLIAANKAINDASQVFAPSQANQAPASGG